jgi:hypothetical protein
MLSYRSKAWINPQRSSPSYLRQCLASSRISAMSVDEVRTQLILFPFVPYAFSLSLSVSYREMRHSKVALNRARARTQFQSTCNMLSELDNIFSSASLMSEMGAAVLKEMDRVAQVAAVSDQRKSQPSPYHVTTTNERAQSKPYDEGNFTTHSPINTNGKPSTDDIQAQTVNVLRPKLKLSRLRQNPTNCRSIHYRMWIFLACLILHSISTLSTIFWKVTLTYPSRRTYRN